MEGSRKPTKPYITTRAQAVLAPIGAEEFQDGGDNGEAKEELESSPEVESQSQSAEDDEESGRKGEAEDASQDQPESAENRESSDGGECSVAESTSAKDDGESGGE